MGTWITASELWITVVTGAMVLGLLIFKPGRNRINSYRESIRQQLAGIDWEKQSVRETGLDAKMVRESGQWLVAEKSWQPLSVYKSFEHSLICWIRGYPALHLLQEMEVLRLYIEARRSVSSPARNLEIRLPSKLGKLNIRFPWRVLMPLLNHLIEVHDEESNLIIELEDDGQYLHFFIKDDGESHNKGQITSAAIPDKYRIPGMVEALSHFEKIYGTSGKWTWLCNRLGEYTLHLQVQKSVATG